MLLKIVNMNKHLLLIDDDEDEKLIFCDALQELETDVGCIYAKGAAQAFDMLGRVRPEIIFVDYNMPRINGLDCIKLLRTVPNLREKPIILYSTTIDESTMKQAKINGASACLVKPSKFEDLKTKLSILLQEHVEAENTVSMMLGFRK